MRVLIIHQEAEYFAGAEVLLGYYLGRLQSEPCEVTVAAVLESRAASVIPKGLPTIPLSANSRFTLKNFRRQLKQTREAVRAGGFDVIHGWSARDWELATATAWFTRRPAVGTLHDHPQAKFISSSRQRLMRWCANRGLSKVICISRAVGAACVRAGYKARKLVVAHNGLPFPPVRPRETRAPGPVRIAFVGALSERKGLRGLFAMMERLAAMKAEPWELFIAGAALEESGAELQRSLRVQYRDVHWSRYVHWCGWVEQPMEWLRGMDILVCPSSEFEPFGLVICEAAGLGIPVLAARVGGPEEMIVDGETGWLFDAGDWAGGAVRLAQVIGDEKLREKVGACGMEHVRQQFGIEKMVAQYVGVYSTLLAV